MKYSFSFAANSMGEYALKYDKKNGDPIFIALPEKITNLTFDREVLIFEIALKYKFEELKEIILKKTMDFVRYTHSRKYIIDFSKDDKKAEKYIEDIKAVHQLFDEIQDFIDNIEEAWV